MNHSESWISCSLLKHQSDAVQYAKLHWFKKGILADAMGLGKCLTSLAIADMWSCKTILIVCPVIVVQHWYQEVSKHTNNVCCLLYHGTKKQETEKLLENKIPVEQESKCTILITTYGIVRRSLSNFLFEFKWDCLLLDEAHTIRNTKSKLFTSVKKLQAEHKICISGTPFNNSHCDIAALCSFLDLSKFDQKSWWKKATLQQISAWRQKYLIMRPKNVIEISPITHHRIVIPSNKYEDSFYNTLLNQASIDVSSKEKDNNKKLLFQTLLVWILRLRQSCNDPRLILYSMENDNERNALINTVLKTIKTENKNNENGLDYSMIKKGSSKTQKLIDIVKNKKGKIVVFSQWTKYLDLIEYGLLDHQILFLRIDGSESTTQKKEKIRKEFETNNNINVLLLSLHACSVGMNLSFAQTVVLMDQWYNPIVEQQAIDRVHRIGQINPVSVYRIISTQKIELAIENIKKKKHNQAQLLLHNKGSYMLPQEEETFFSLKELSSLFKSLQSSIQISQQSQVQ